MSAFGDGETGKTSMDSSKKDGRGTGGRVIRFSEAWAVVPFGVVVVSSVGILTFVEAWLVGRASPWRASVRVSLGAM